MQTLADQRAFLRKKKVVVKFAHLNPELQEKIGSSFIDFNSFSVPGLRLPIRTLRTWRALNDLIAGFNAASFTIGRAPANAAGSLISFGGRTALAIVIQTQHEKLLEQMNSHGILAAEHEQHYPPDWMRPAEVARTHPIFYVAMNGDLVFLKENARERLRWKLQQTRPVKYLGLNPWRWRGYLRPPKALQPIGEKVKGLARGLREKAGSLGGQPAPQRALARFSKRK